MRKQETEKYKAPNILCVITSIATEQMRKIFSDLRENFLLNTNMFHTITRKNILYRELSSFIRGNLWILHILFDILVFISQLDIINTILVYFIHLQISNFVKFYKFYCNKNMVEVLNVFHTNISFSLFSHSLTQMRSKSFLPNAIVFSTINSTCLCFIQTIFQRRYFTDKK